MSRLLVSVGGVLILVSALPHALLGWPAIHERLDALSAGRDLIDGIAVAWHFGSAAMLALGAAVLVAVPELSSSRWAWRLPLYVGLVYLAFGVGAFSYRSMHPRFLVFVGIGALLVLGSLGARKEVPKHPTRQLG